MENNFEIENGFVRTTGAEKDFVGYPPAGRCGESAAFAVAARPFLTPITVPLDERVAIVTEKLLVAPKTAVKKRRVQRVIPFSFRSALRVTEISGSWAVAASASRTRRLVLAEGEVATVAVNAVVAWSGRAPTGFLPRLRLRDLFLPRAKPQLFLHFYGPSVIWHEGV